MNIFCWLCFTGEALLESFMRGRYQEDFLMLSKYQTHSEILKLVVCVTFLFLKIYPSLFSVQTQIPFISFLVNMIGRNLIESSMSFPFWLIYCGHFQSEVFFFWISYLKYFIECELQRYNINDYDQCSKLSCNAQW